MSEPDRVLTADEVAHQLRVSKWLIYRLVKGGTLPAIELGRTLRFSAAAVDRLIAGGTLEENAHPDD